jgi:beta-ureidopropionase / N-carbamoyl-L-amino-acid hydrolase
MDMETRKPQIDEARLWADVMALAKITEPDRPYTRRSFSQLFLEGRKWLADRYRAAGLSVRIDAAGNLIGRLAGIRTEAPSIMVGSHSDSVPNGGRFDGIAGVLVGLEIARALTESGTQLVHALEVVDFLAEEPSEFGLSCIGSRAMAGALDSAHLDLAGPGQETLAAAIERVGGVPGKLAEARRDDVHAFLELHIEQGPVLEATGIDVGIVSAIVGITRIEICLEGEAAHAGTAPMEGRRDAGAAAAEVVLAVRDLARELSALGEGYFVATSGVLEIRPNAANVVPGNARLVIDARSEKAALMQRFLADLHRRTSEIALSNATALARFAILSHNDPAACDSALQHVLEASAAAMNCSAKSMASGAGHDAAFVSRIAPAAMLFVPCLGGRSHCPEEWTDQAELAAGAAVMLDAVRRIDRDPLPAHGSGTQR